MPDKQKKMDLDEPVNADIDDPDEALRILLGEERREQRDDDAEVPENEDE
jgi:hypothetical protein